MNEKELQVYVNADLRKMRIGFWHREKGGFHKSRSHNTFKFDPKDKTEPKKSWPDLLIQPGNGKLFYVELKKKDGKQSDEQKAFQEWAISMGYKYYVCFDITSWALIKSVEGL